TNPTCWKSRPSPRCKVRLRRPVPGHALSACVSAAASVRCIYLGEDTCRVNIVEADRLLDLLILRDEVERMLHLSAIDIAEAVRAGPVGEHVLGRDAPLSEREIAVTLREALDKHVRSRLRILEGEGVAAQRGGEETPDHLGPLRQRFVTDDKAD